MIFFQDFPGRRWFSRTFPVLEFSRKKIQDFPGGVGTLQACTGYGNESLVSEMTHNVLMRTLNPDTDSLTHSLTHYLLLIHGQGYITLNSTTLYLQRFSTGLLGKVELLTDSYFAHEWVNKYDVACMWQITRIVSYFLPKANNTLMTARCVSCLVYLGSCWNTVCHYHLYWHTYYIVLRIT